MAQRVYKELANHLNADIASKFPETQELFEILEILFTPEQAEYAIKLPMTNSGRVTVDDLAAKMNRDARQVLEVVETMVKAGTVLASTSRKDGRKYYALWPLAPGMLESTCADGIDSPQRRRLSKLYEQYKMSAYLNELGSSDYPLLRIIPINENIDSESRVLPFEEVRNIIENAEVITVIPCLCRSISKKCNHIMEADFVFGAWADNLIN